MRGGPNPGDSWCICMWAYARMISSAGCNHTHIHCNSTDVGHVMSNYVDGGHKLDGAQECLRQKCPDEVASFEGTNGELL